MDMNNTYVLATKSKYSQSLTTRYILKAYIILLIIIHFLRNNFVRFKVNIKSTVDMLITKEWYTILNSLDQKMFDDQTIFFSSFSFVDVMFIDVSHDHSWNVREFYLISNVLIYEALVYYFFFVMQLNRRNGIVVEELPAQLLDL